MPATASVSLTGNLDIDGILDGIRWLDPNLTFSFPTSLSQYGYSETGFEAMNDAQMAAVRAILSMYASISDLTFTEVTESDTTHGTIRFAEEDNAGTAYGYYPNAYFEQGGDVWLNHTDYNNPLLGTYAYATFMHEIGHTLGLDHGQDGIAALPTDHDSLEYSVMTYRSFVGADLNGYTVRQGSFPTTLMLDDVAAIQYMYGANYNTRSGDTVYKWSPTTGELSIDGVGQGASTANKIFMTVWDGGGEDTYDFSAYTTGVTVDLNPGAWTTTSSTQLADLGSSFYPGHYARGNIANAYLYDGNTASLIEDAIGGSGNDTIVGNQADNRLDGGSGNDTLTGGAGDDTIIGGDGIDTCVIGADFSDCTISWDSLSAYLTIASAADGTDQVTEVEDFDFSDVTMTLDQIIAGLAVTSVVTYDLANDPAIHNLTLIGSDNIDGFGNDLDNVIIGNAGENVLDGRGGADTLEGGLGNDTYVLADGTDTVIDTGGWDTITSTISRDLNDYPDIENLTLLGSANINATGNAWSNTLIGNDGDNILDGGPGADKLMGGLGNDTYVLAGATNDTIIDSGGNDTITSTISRDLRNYTGIENLMLTFSANADATGTDGDNVLTGNAGRNTLTGLDGNDTLYGMDGNDILDGGAGQDTLYGGLGNDTYVLADGFDTVIDSGGWDTITSTISRDLNDYPDIENLTLTGHADINATGNQWSNTLIGNDGDNILDGGPGADTLMGGLGNDTYVLAGATNDTIYDAGGIDTITSTISRDLRNYIGIENLTLTFSAWVDATGDQYANVLTGNSGQNTLNGLDGDDTLYGMAGNDILNGGNGNDILDGGDGQDTLNGGQGNDTYVLGDGFDAVVDTGGWDTITSTVSRNLNDYPDIENLTLLGHANASLTGNSWSNTLIGNDGNNTIDGGPGADTLMGGLGNDTYLLAGATNDAIIDTGGWDTITSTISRDLRTYIGIENLTLTFSANVDGIGTEGANILTGNAGNNVLTALGGNDTLVGNGGNDTLTGGLGVDTMTGGSGNDSFVFQSLADSGTGANADVITDFTAGQDKLDFTQIDANPSTPTDDAFSLLTAIGAAFTHTAGEVRWYQDDEPGTGNDATLVEIDANGDGIADFQIHLNGLVSLTSSDFAL